jgi:hypothetical protein
MHWSPDGESMPTATGPEAPVSSVQAGTAAGGVLSRGSSYEQHIPWHSNQCASWQLRSSPWSWW